MVIIHVALCRFPNNQDKRDLGLLWKIMDGPIGRVAASGGGALAACKVRGPYGMDSCQRPSSSNPSSQHVSRVSRELRMKGLAGPHCRSASTLSHRCQDLAKNMSDEFGPGQLSDATCLLCSSSSKSFGWGLGFYKSFMLPGGFVSTAISLQDHVVSCASLCGICGFQCDSSASMWS